MPQEIENYNWAKHKGLKRAVKSPASRIEIDDETWRDGLQGTQLMQHPSVDKKIEYLDIAARRGYINHADIGFPASGERHRGEIGKIIDHVTNEKLPLTLSTAGRGAAKDDVVAILQLAQKHSVP